MNFTKLWVMHHLHGKKVGDGVPSIPTPLDPNSQNIKRHKP